MELSTSGRRRLQDGSCRVALAAYLHDLGKLAQRAEVFDDDPRRQINQQLYCPQWFAGTPQAYFTHLHAGDTALAIDALEAHFPLLRSEEPFPFAPADAPDATDSLINAAAAHHRPETFLQWCIASADRIASGFEREAFEQGYNKARDRDDYKKARMLVAFEEYRGREAGRVPADNEMQLHWRYPLLPLSPRALMPIKAQPIEPAQAVAEYRRLWNLLFPAQGANGGVGLVPKSHRQNWALWLDHFDSLWQIVAHAIPSATAGNTRPDVSLYDHSRTTAALATAIWRFHHDRADDPQACARAQARRDDWDEEKFLLIQGDFTGIQDFIFGGNATVQKKAARLLRGRSAMVSLITEIAAVRLLDAMGLPPTSVVINAAGKLLILAPNTPMVEAAIKEARAQIDRWFCENLFGLAGMVVAITPAAPNDFVQPERFQKVRERLVRALEQAKRQRLGLCGADAPSPVFAADYSHGACAFDARLPAEAGLEEDGAPAHALSAACIRLGTALASQNDQRLLILESGALSASERLLPLSVLGYDIAVAAGREIDGNFGALAVSGALRRAFDFSLPAPDLAAVAWNGFARRSLAAFVPVHRHDPAQDPRYDDMDGDQRGTQGALKTFEHLAKDDRKVDDSEGSLSGIEALGILKGDIDDLGALFQGMLKCRPSFAAWAELSRRINAFFTIWVPARLADDAAFRNIYTVFAGGDDFLFIGPWRTLRKFAVALREDFTAYVAENALIHFSAGYALAKPGHPIRQLVESAETALERAKARGASGSGDPVADVDRKNAIGLHGSVIAWYDWPLVDRLAKTLACEVGADDFSNQFTYGLLALSKMAADQTRPENARWRARLHYQTRRLVERHRHNSSEPQHERIARIVETIGEEGIARNPDAFRIALTERIYSLRD